MRRQRHRWRRALLLLPALWLGLALWHVHKPLPEGLHVDGPPVATPATALEFLVDVAAPDGHGGMLRQRAIHDATLELVRDARDFLVLDYFLFNAQGGPAGPLAYEDGRTPVAAELVAAVRLLKQQQPELPVLLLTDPINDYYRGSAPPALAGLRAAGVDVVVTALSPLRDSNPLYSATWRLLFGWWLPTRGEGWLPNVLDSEGPDLKLGALLRLPNFKANHRKLALTGDGAGSLVGIVASANPHDASSAHSNVALRIEGEALRPLLASELAIARFSGADARRLATLQIAAGDGEGRRVADSADADADAADEATANSLTTVRILTEGAIRDAVLARFAAAGAGDAIDVAQFYLSDNAVIDALRAAALRGVQVRLLLDPNRDAFGFEKSGIPNRPLANALLRDTRGAPGLRWYRTSGEQFHAKLALVRKGERLWFTLGSANFTRRNLGDYNLEANVAVETPMESAVAHDVTGWFTKLWTNAEGVQYSSPAQAWTEDSLLRYWQARLMEATGLSTF